jgi:hypothetical protein
VRGAATGERGAADGDSEERQTGGAYLRGEGRGVTVHAGLSPLTSVDARPTDKN